MFTKIIDKLLDPIEYLFLKPLKINTNTFFAYLFGLLTIYFAVDRLAEYIRVFFTGEYLHYWSTWGYVGAMACTVIAYGLICASPLNTTLRHPMKFFVFYSLCFYAICIGMVSQWSNELIWYLLMKCSNFKFIIANLPEVIVPAVGGLSILLPMLSFRKMWNYYVGNVIDGDDDWIESFEDYKGIKLVAASNKKETPDCYLCEAPIAVDVKTGKTTMIPEKLRFEATLVEGATGTGKTATIVEPMCANDIERKFFFRELSKKLAYNALQAGLAEINVPYSNEYLNATFSLSYLTPKESKFSEYKNYVKDMIKYVDPETNKIYYRGLGFTLVAPDNACIERVRKVADAYHIPVNVVDPSDPNSLGINPFTGKDPAKIAAIISTVLKAMNEADGGKDDTFFQSVAQQAFENLAILLKLIYPRMHDGEMPTLEDMLAILNNFDIAEEMCEVLKKDPDLAEDYKSLIGYFEKNFYKPPVNIHGYEISSTYGSGRKKTEEVVYGAITQLDNFLRNPGVKRVLCSRNNNIDFDQALENGELITACTRQGNLGEIHQRAFGMFFILSFKDAVLRRPGKEDTRTAHFIYIDEFPLYVNKDVEAFFTLFRKYRCGTLITIQNLSQLSRVRALNFKDIVLTNTKTQIVFGDLTADESEFWSKEFGKKKKWDYKTKKILDTSTEEGAKAQTEAFMQAKQDFTDNFKPGKIFGLKFKQCVYKTKTRSGSSITGLGKTDFIKADYYKEHKMSTYDFELFGHTPSPNSSTSASETSPTYADKVSSVSSDDPIKHSTGNNSNDFVTKKANNKIEDIFIDLDNDGINDLSHAKNYGETVIDLGKKNSDSNNDDAVIIKF